MVVGHVGDTRLYKIRNGSVRKVTRDHSPVGEREDAGQIGEVEAMRHPRRNEVFRDVGSIFRDKDEQEFVDVIDEAVEPDAALLVCSDGLSDMLPSATILHIVRQHAADPARVVDALVAAANDAGGKDNVTVVYAEGPRFADSLRGDLTESLTPTEPLDDSMRPPASVTRPAPTGLRAPHSACCRQEPHDVVRRRHDCRRGRCPGADVLRGENAGSRGADAGRISGWKRAVPRHQPGARTGTAR